jgi:hypothetical protein
VIPASLGDFNGSPNHPATRPTRVLDGVEVRLTVPSNLDVSQCDHGQYRTWGSGAKTLVARGPGQRDLVWLTGTSPGDLIIDAATFPNTPTRLVHEVNGILDSVSFKSCLSC